MKVLYVCNLPSFIKQHLQTHIRYLEKQGLTVECVCPEDKETAELQAAGIIIHSLPIDRKIDPMSNYQCVMRLAKLMRKGGYDVVHVHNPVASILGRVAARLAGIKKVIYTSHGLFIHDLTPPLPYTFFWSAEVFASQLTNLIFSVNREDIQRLSIPILCPENRFAYLGSVGVDIKDFDPRRITLGLQNNLRQEFKIPEDAFPIVGTIGRINEKKGSLFFIEAIHQLQAKYPNIHTLIIGEEVSSDPDGCQNKAQQQIYDLNLENNITLTGYRDDIPELLSLMDAFCLPTFAHEGLPSAVIEAMAMEKPVVASNIRGCREAIINQETGFIIPPRNTDALANALDFLLANPEQAKQMGVRGRQRVLENYSMDLVLQRLHQGYQALGILSEQHYPAEKVINVVS